MRHREAVALATVVAISMIGSKADADGLLDCRVRVVRAAASDRPSNVVREVESWVDVRDFGVTLVPSIAHADVLLEVTKHTLKLLADGTPEQAWWFVARRLGGPGIHRFVLVARDLREGPRLVSERLPVILIDVCQGRLPRTQASEQDPK